MLKKIILSALLICAASAIGFAQDASPTKTTTTKTTTTKTTATPAPTPPLPKIKIATATAASTANTPDAKAVRAAFDRLVEGIEESDVDKVMSVYQNSLSTLYFNNNGSITRGYAQDKLNREARYPRITNAKLVPSNVRVDLLGAGGALLTCEWTQTQDFDGVPEPAPASGRMTLVFKKIGKEWKIVHLHTSPDAPPPARPVFSSERQLTKP